MKTQKHSKVVQVSWDLELENKIVSIGSAVGIKGTELTVLHVLKNNYAHALTVLRVYKTTTVGIK